MWTLFKKKKKYNPDVEKFNDELAAAIGLGQSPSPEEIAAMFRHLFVLNDPVLGKKVLFILMSWLGEYETMIPTDADELQRYAGKRQVAGLIKTAMHADLSDTL